LHQRFSPLVECERFLVRKFCAINAPCRSRICEITPVIVDALHELSTHGTDKKNWQPMGRQLMMLCCTRWCAVVIGWRVG